MVNDGTYSKSLVPKSVTTTVHAAQQLVLALIVLQLVASVNNNQITLYLWEFWHSVINIFF